MTFAEFVVPLLWYLYIPHGPTEVEEKEQLLLAPGSSAHVMSALIHSVPENPVLLWAGKDFTTRAVLFLPMSIKSKLEALIGEYEMYSHFSPALPVQIFDTCTLKYILYSSEDATNFLNFGAYFETEK